jgi:hypothetical protein
MIKRRHLQIFCLNTDVFSIDTRDVGKCDILKQQLTLTEKNKVCSTPPYRLPHHLLPIAHKYVDKLVSSDVIRSSKSPFLSHLCWLIYPVERI